MAKSKKSAVSKTQSVKEALAKFPSLGPKDLAAKLGSRGVKVTPAYVSTIKSGMRRKAKQRSSATRALGRNGGPGRGYVAVDALSHAKELVEKAGGVAEARKALDIIAQFS